MHDRHAEPPAWFRDALVTPVATHSVFAGTTTIACRQWGDPRQAPVILVHGYGAHSRWWDHIAPLLAGGFSVWAPDLSGHGESGWRTDYHVDSWAADLMAVTEQLSAHDRAPIVVAHSMGGRIACAAAERAGSAWRGLLLLDSTLGHAGTDREAGSAPRAVRGSVFATKHEALARFRLRPAQPTQLPYIIDHIAEHSVRRFGNNWGWKTDPRTRLAAGTPLPPGVLSRIDCRIALLRGQFGLVASDAGDWMSAAARKPVAVAEIPLAHHHMMIDEPLGLVSALRTALSAWDAADFATEDTSTQETVA